MDTIIRLFALENAIKFNGKANPGSVVPKVLGSDPSLKAKMQEVMPRIQAIVQEVNALSLDQQKEKLLALQPDFFEKQKEQKKQRQEERKELPPLPHAEEGAVVTRISPEPSKYNHLGHAISFLLNYLYAQKYKGTCILRFEDTNPEKAQQEYIDAMNEDVLSYLDIKVDKTIIVSDHMATYYEMAEQLISKGLAYTCTDASDVISHERREMIASKDRDKSIAVVEKEWAQMKEGKYEEGTVTLRLKIDMEHKNAVMRDPVIFRLCYTPHYRTGKKYLCWPMYDFENAIEEGLSGVTHVLRSNEFASRIELQDHIRSLFDLPNPVVKQYARYNITGALTQGREIREKIEDGTYIGWDDPRLVTLRALKRRGIVKEAFYELAKVIGMSKTNSNLDFSVIAAINRRILDEAANRYFFIPNPVAVSVVGAPRADVELNLHPHKRKGGRTFSVGTDLYLDAADLAAVKAGELFRLMDCMNVRKQDDGTLAYAGNDLQQYKKEGSRIIHWLPADDRQVKDVEILMPDNTVQRGKAEVGVMSLAEGTVIQFERFGFCRLDDKQMRFWYTHD